MRCDLCLVYRPNVEKEDRRTEICDVWKKIWEGFEPDPNTVICDGCCCEREEAILFSTECETRMCVMEKGIEHCDIVRNIHAIFFQQSQQRKKLFKK